jgi:hypothetical protein
MFDFNLTDITATLSVGLLGLTILGYLYFITQRFFYKNFDHKSFIGQVKEQLGSNHEKSGYVVLGTILIYGMGFIIGDLTGRMTNSDSDQHNFLDWLSNRNGMKKQEDTRWDAFVKSDTSNGLAPTSLAYSIFRTDTIANKTNHLAGTHVFVNNYDKYENGPSKNRCPPNKKQRIDKNLKDSLAAFIHQFYYTSKNWCYSEDKEPLKELKAIQNRIDMLRSFVFLMDFSALSLFIIVIGKLCYIVSLSINQRFNDWDFWRQGIIRRFFYLSQIHIFCIFFIIFYISKQCFEIDQDNFLKRACGYYVSHVNELDCKAPKTQVNKD